MKKTANGSDDKGCARLHNVKFYNLAPRAINCMAYNRLTSKLAISRNDAAIEIWDMRNAPFMERTMVGSSVEAMCWVGSELLTAGLNGQISHWDLKSLSIKQSLMVTGNAIWCIDAFGQTIAAGTEEGYLNICEFNSDLESLQYVRIMDKQDGRILCCKFDQTGNFLVTGSLDVLRVWDVKSGHVIHKMTTGRTEAKKETIIWQVVVLKDLKIASVDSRGKLTIWDGKVGQLESYQALQKDALCLAVDEKEEILYVSGIEPVICSYTLTNFKRDNQQVQKWVRTSVRYPHTHDVKALIVTGEKVLSGGVDGNLCITQFKEKTSFQYGPFLERPSVLTTENRLILLKYVNYIEIWRLGESGFVVEAKDEEEPEEITKIDLLVLKESPLKLVELLSKNKETITCATISNNGQWILYSTTNRIRLFNLQTNNSDKAVLSPVLPSDVSKFTPANRCLFSPDSKFLLLHKATGEIDVFELIENEMELDFKQTIDTSKFVLDTIHLMAMSHCCQYLIVAGLCNSVVVFQLQQGSGKKKSLSEWKHFANLPKYSCPAVTLTVHPKQTHLVIVSYADGKLVEYDLNQLKFSYSTMLDCDAFANQNLVVDPRKSDLMLIQTEKSIFSVTKTEKSEQNQDEKEEINTKRSKKEGRKSRVFDQSNYTKKIVKEAKHFVHLSWLGDNDDELVGVEINPVVLLDQLPQTLKLKKYGTG